MHEEQIKTHRTIAVIGTAGRDRQHPMNRKHWDFMCQTLADELKPSDYLVSGGAAWADHVAVWAYMENLCEHLILHLPAPFNGVQFAGDYGTSGGAANYYHRLFSQTVGFNSREQLRLVLEQCDATCQPVRMGYQAMTDRNRLVAQQCDHMVAFTFGLGNQPADGGTLITWNMAHPAVHKAHVSLCGI